MDDKDPDDSDPDDIYPLGPPGKTLADHEYTVLPLYHEPEIEEPAKKEPLRLQFTLAQLLWAMTFVAVGLSVVQCFPVDFARPIAAVAGIGLLVSLGVLELTHPQDNRIYVVWWIGVGIYVLSSLAAVFRG